MSTLTITGLVFTSFMILLALFAYTGKRLSQREMTDAKESKDSTSPELRDVAIILQDGTVYESYQGVLLTLFSDRIYHLHAMNSTKKELVARLHLGDGMMLKVTSPDKMA
jgi:hypothetical protein